MRSVFQMSGNIRMYNTVKYYTIAGHRQNILEFMYMGVCFGQFES